MKAICSHIRCFVQRMSGRRRSRAGRLLYHSLHPVTARGEQVSPPPRSRRRLVTCPSRGAVCAALGGVEGGRGLCGSTSGSGSGWSSPAARAGGHGVYLVNSHSLSDPFPEVTLGSLVAAQKSGMGSHTHDTIVLFDDSVSVIGFLRS